ncbi:hypothetical protein V1264_009220 [Littorina saxatilis]|uniref:Retrotransposon gag domain-containing protein n=1 Tax=Littorina saxatilis TaxID=31220 RepID=A0AAN9ARH8_9CAEN
MAAALPSFEKFNVFSDEQSASVRWRRWVARFENLLCALDITKDARKKALLLHFCGDEVYNIVESFSEEKKGAGATRQVEGRAVPNEYVTLRDSLTEYFTPKKNTAYEVLRFRKSTQLEGESIDTFHTRLRALASTCEFHNNDQEILTQILQGCHSQRLRRRALRDNFDLDHLLAEARDLELSETRAVEIEGSVNALSINKQRRYSQSVDRITFAVHNHTHSPTRMVTRISNARITRLQAARHASTVVDSSHIKQDVQRKGRHANSAQKSDILHVSAKAKKSDTWWWRIPQFPEKLDVRRQATSQFLL